MNHEILQTKLSHSGFCAHLTVIDDTPAEKAQVSPTNVAIARWLERHQPHRRNTESVQIVQPAHEPLELTDSISISISICIHESRDRETMDHCAKAH